MGSKRRLQREADGVFVMEKVDGGWKRIDSFDTEEDAVEQYPGLVVEASDPIDPNCSRI